MSWANPLATIQAAAPAAQLRPFGAGDPLIVVPAEQWRAAALAVRDRLGGHQCRCLSGVDWLHLGLPSRLGPTVKTVVPGIVPSESLAVLVHIGSTQHPGVVTLCCEVPRNRPQVPSLGEVWPVAAWFEREAFDLYGIQFTGHPDLRRLLLPDDWEGHPGRRDAPMTVSYHGVAHARADRSGPHAHAGEVPSAPDQTPASAGEKPASLALLATPRIEVAAECMTLHLGPHHPATHGVLRLELETDGEIVRHCRPDIGYLHRAIEKICEAIPYDQVTPYTDRVDYVCAMNANLAWVLAVERLLALDPATAVVVPRRAEVIRVLVAELDRISSHLVAVGALAMDLGAYTPFLHAIAQRETVNDLFERTCGARLTHNYLTIGGVERDLYAGAEGDIHAFLGDVERELVRFHRLITGNPIFRERCAGVAVVSAAEATAYGLVGPNLRGSGVGRDVRKDEPYGLYAELGFTVPVGEGFAGRHGAVGDAFDRYIVRSLEMLESISLCRQALALLPAKADQASHPEGGWQADASKALRKPPAGHVYVASEAPRGEHGYAVLSDGAKQPYRVRIKTGSFTALSLFERLLPGCFLADVVTIIGSFDIVLPEVDR
jgi:NADH:ubiquinone oxidoreductase subunit D/NADH:ubiquinone oxidoreductase subunit C